MKIACLVTGAPRTFRRCVDSLKFFLSQHEVDYYLVYRDENSDPETDRELLSAYNPVAVHVTSVADTKKFEIPGMPHAPLLRMWYEVLLGRDLIKPRRSEYDLFLRVRFDNFFVAEFCPVFVPQGSCIIPTAYEYLGCNDMFCLANWAEFSKYCDLFNSFGKTPKIYGNSYTPEAITLHYLMEQKITADFRDIGIGIRRPWHDNMSEREFREAVYKFPSHLLMKYQEQEKDPAGVLAAAENLAALVKQDAIMPLNSRKPLHWYDSTIDARSGLPFRFFLYQAFINIAIDSRVTSFQVDVHHKVRDIPIDRLRIYLNGESLKLEIVENEWGSWTVFGDVPLQARGKAPHSKMAFFFGHTVVPAEEGSNPNDHRRLSASVGIPRFYDESGEAFYCY